MQVGGFILAPDEDCRHWRLSESHSRRQNGIQSTVNLASPGFCRCSTWGNLSSPGVTWLVLMILCFAGCRWLSFLHKSLCCDGICTVSRSFLGVALLSRRSGQFSSQRFTMLWNIAACWQPSCSSRTERKSPQQISKSRVMPCFANFLSSQPLSLSASHPYTSARAA